MNIEVTFKDQSFNLDGLNVIASVASGDIPVFDHHEGSTRLYISEVMAQLFDQSSKFRKDACKIYNEYISKLDLVKKDLTLGSRQIKVYPVFEGSGAEYWLSKVGHGNFFYASAAIRSELSEDKTITISTEDSKLIRVALDQAANQLQEIVAEMCDKLKEKYRENTGRDFEGVLAKAA